MAGPDDIGSTPRVTALARGGLIVLLGCLVCQMGLGLAYILPVVLKDIVAEFGWSRALFAGSSAPMLLAMGLASPLVGALTDRFGARQVLAGGIIGVAACLWAFSFMQSIVHFYLINLLFGLALTGVGDIPVGTVASRWFVRHRGAALAVVYIGSNLGGALATNAVDAVRTAESWQTAFRVMGVSAIVVLLPFALFAVRNPPDAAAPDDTSAAADDARGLSLAEALRTRSFWILGALLFAFYFYYLGINQHLVSFLTDHGYSDAQAARRFSAAILLGVAGKLLIGLLADRIPARRALLLNFAALTVGSFVLLGVGNRSLLPVFLVLHGFTVAAENVLLPLIVAHCFGVRFMARIYGTLMLALPLGGILGPIFAGAIHDRWESYTPAFMSFAFLNLASLGLLGLVRRETP